MATSAPAERIEEPAEPGPRSERWLVGWARRPFAGSVALAAAAISLFVGLELALGRVALLLSDEAPAQLREDFRIAMVLIAVVAYLPAATLHLTRTARQAARALGPALAAGGARLADAVGRLPAGGLSRAGLMGIAIYLGIQALVDRNPAESFAVWAIPPEALVHRLCGLANGWLMGRFVYALGVTSRRLFRLGSEGLAVDVLDREPLSPLARQALRHALLVLGLLSLMSLLFVDVAAAPGLWQVLTGAVVVMGVLAALCLALPVLGARAAIARAKSLELAWCNDAIRRRRAALAAGDDAAASGLADLVAYKEHVAAASEWILDAPILARFILYLGLPLGSWLGGAFVERIVDGMLE